MRSTRLSGSVLIILSITCLHVIHHQPPLPEEDYPADEDTPSPPGKGDSYSFAGSSEYSLAHVKKAVIPRACLDRSAPAGWTLSVDSDGVWIFTNDHTQEQVGHLITNSIYTFLRFKQDLFISIFCFYISNFINDVHVCVDSGSSH